MPPIKELSTVDLDAVLAAFDTNVIGALRLTRLFTPALAATDGSVTMINSRVVRFSQRTTARQCIDVNCGEYHH